MSRRIARLVLAKASALAALLLAGCAGTQPGAHARAHPRSTPAPTADSATVALWHFDEAGGTRVADAGPFGLEADAGLDTRTDFGRFRSARVFQSAKDSWVYVPYNPVMDIRGPMTIEAWVNVGSISLFELQVIASRWSPVPNEQSWVFGVSGYGSMAGQERQTAPGWFRDMLTGVSAQHLFFGYVPDGAGAQRGYASTGTLPLGRWVHVAATVDGEVVRLFIDGQLDAQYVNQATVRPSPAPLVFGNAIDERHLTTFGSDLRIDPEAPVSLYYPFDGLIDEVRLSRGARLRYESTIPR
jgi:hypothetical protein